MIQDMCTSFDVIVCTSRVTEVSTCQPNIFFERVLAQRLSFTHGRILSSESSFFLLLLKHDSDTVFVVKSYCARVDMSTV